MSLHEPSPDAGHRMTARDGNMEGAGPSTRRLWPLALLLGLVTLLADQVADIVRLIGVRAELQQAHEAQAVQLEQASRIETQLDALAASTARLAREGNQNAATIVASLRAQGVSINPDGSTSR